MKFEFNKDGTLRKAFTGLSKLNNEWSQTYLKQVEINETEVITFFDYFKKEKMSLSELESKVQVARSDYETAKRALDDERQRLFSLKPEEWELEEGVLAKIKDKSDKTEVLPYFCGKLQKEVDCLRAVLGHYMHNLSAEKKRISEFQGRKFKNHFRALAARNMEYLSDSAMMVKLLNFRL